MLLSTKLVQSNVVRRSAVLLAGLMQLPDVFDNREFSNVEIGASAGLTLLWQKYSYKYGEGGILGNIYSDVLIETELRGNVPFDPSSPLPNVIENIGIELDPIDPGDESAMDWLRALIFPEHQDNRMLFDEALEVVNENPLQMHQGDALKLLPELIDSVVDDRPVNVYHSHSLNQFSQASRQEVDSILSEASLERDITRLAFEATPQGFSDLQLIRYENGERHDAKWLANCEAHGRWIDWQ